MRVCSDHFKDEFIKAYITKKSSQDNCDYCDDSNESISVTDLAVYIEKAIEFEYDDPYNQGAQYDPSQIDYEDRFSGITVFDTMELLEDILEIDDFRIIETLSQKFSNNYWTLTESIWGATRDQFLKSGWEAFKEIIKYKVRFLFFNKSSQTIFENKDGESLNPFFALEEVGKAIVELNLIVKIPEGELSVYRGRQHSNTETFKTSTQLGSPPPSLAKANRMSPAGISMFYGAHDIATCEMEISNMDWKDSSITIANFTNLRDLNLVDLTFLKTIPSLFDKIKRDQRPIASFILSFIKDVSVPVKPDDSVHIDYIPTQVITEYIKVILGKRHKIDGIIYNSVKNNYGKCIVLFVESTEILNSEITKILGQDLNKYILSMDTKSITTKQI